MYIPHSFRVDDDNELFAFCKASSFGLVVTNSTTGAPEISHVPFVLKRDKDSNWIIELHLANANFQCTQFEKNTICGLQISGSHGYISSSVYSHENVPTYNYESVYLTCESQVLSTAELENHLNELVNQFEKGRKSPLNYTQFNRTMIDEYLREITGIRLKVLKTEGAFKLSQNRTEQDLDAIVNDNTMNPDLCSAMLKHYKND